MEKDIVIIGAGITGLTAAFRLTRKGRDVQVLERSDRVGGQIRTFRDKDGFVCESGPNTGVVSYPEVAELFADLEDLDPACRLETADEAAKRRLIWKGKRFHTLPSGLLSGITTPLFTLYDKFRILGEPWRPVGTDPDESVGAMAVRRLGKSFLDYAVDPFLSGVYAGDPMKLVTRYALPKLYNLEHEYGSFIRGSIAKARQPKTERDRLATKKVFSAQGGFDNLTTALAKAIGEQNITLAAEDVRIEPAAYGKWRITYKTDAGVQAIVAAKVVTTTGAYTLPGLLPFVDPREMARIGDLQYAPVVQAAVGIRDTGGLRFNAFGGLVPSCENRDLLGILFPSACFGGRAPVGGALFSFFIGGVRRRELTLRTDGQIEALVSESFHSMLGFPANVEPDFIRIYRHPLAIPQYEKDSGRRFETIRRLESLYPGLTLAGNIRDGIGMSDRIRQANVIADRL